MNLQDLNAALVANNWLRGPEDVEVLVDNGNGEAYTLDEVFDQGNHVVLVGDRTPTAPEPDPEVVALMIPRQISCPMPPRGWRCMRPLAHVGPCAVEPRWWNRSRSARLVRSSS